VRGAPPSSAAEPDGGREMGRVFFFAIKMGRIYEEEGDGFGLLIQKECWNFG
jgi:hypothetical protein